MRLTDLVGTPLLLLGNARLVVLLLKSLGPSCSTSAAVYERMSRSGTPR